MPPIQDMQPQLQDQIPSSKVLVTPELLTLVAQYLNRRQLFYSLQVCRGWHQTILPLYWHDVFIVDNSLPPLPALRKHADLVLTLVVQTEALCQSPFELQEITLPRLHTLGIYQDRRGFEEPEKQRETLEPLVELIKRHQSSLTKIGLESLTSQELMDAIAGCTELEELKVDYLRLDSPELWMKHYDSFWSRLRSLTVRGPWFTEPIQVNSLTGAMLAERLQAHSSEVQFRYLNMQGSGNDMLQIQSSLIQKSSELNELKWVSSGFQNDSIPLALLAKSIQVGRFSRQLEILSVPFAVFEDEDLRLVLESVKLRELDFNYTGFSASSWSVLKNEVPRFMTTLKSLTLAACANITGAVVHDILCSVTSLETFYADYLKLSNLVEDGRDWVCAGLKSLTMAILMDAGRGQEDHRFVISRLSRLTRLEFLDMGPECYGREYNVKDVPSQAMLFQGPMPTMERGMEQLVSLTRIRFFGVCPEQGVGWTLDDTQWAIDHWPYLNELSGMNFYSNPVELCKKAGVSLTDCRVLQG